MSQLVADCPRCFAKHTAFDFTAYIWTGERWGWAKTGEGFCVCRNCKKSTIFKIVQRDQRLTEPVTAWPSLTGVVEVEGFVSIGDTAAEPPPEHLPDDVRNAFVEGARCLAVQCYNAAGTMFRLCLDLATKPLLPTSEVEGLNSKTRRDLGLRLPWLFNNGKLPDDLRDHSTCIREDGNDGAHAGSLSKDDALDIQEFTIELLERIITTPRRLEIAKDRRAKRRELSSSPRKPQ